MRSAARHVAAALFLAAAMVVPAGAKQEVPLDGALAASDPAPSPGDRIVVYLDVTALTAAKLVRVKVVLPDGVRADSAPTESQFEDVGAGKTVVFAVPVRVDTAEPRRVVATATIADSPAFKLERAFVLELNRGREMHPQARPGVDAKGRPLAVYESGN
jgi:hypothetical protein